jgi:hypothetical protein
MLLFPFFLKKKYHNDEHLVSKVPSLYKIPLQIEHHKCSEPKSSHSVTFISYSRELNLPKKSIPLSGYIINASESGADWQIHAACVRVNITYLGQRSVLDK